MTTAVDKWPAAARLVAVAAAGHLPTAPTPPQGTRPATPPTPPGIRVTYHGGSTGLSLDKDMESGETDRVEVAVGQCLLNRRVSGHAPEPRRRTGGDRCIELRYAVTAQFVEAVVPVLPLPPKIRA